MDLFEGAWHQGNVPIMGPRTHAAWLGSTVFDGARAFEGVAPDLERHCARINQSAINFGLKPVVDAETWLGLAREGIARFAPMRNFTFGRCIGRRPEAAAGCCSIPRPPTGASASISRRCHSRPATHHAIAVPPADRGERAGPRQGGVPLPEQFARADGGAGEGLYNGLMLDMLGNVAEFGNANVFMAKNGVVFTPAPNGTFLNGITRQRVIDSCEAMASPWSRRP